MCRSWPHLPCSSSLCGMASSPHWSVAPLLANIWDGCCTSCSVLVTSPLLSTTKGMTYFSGSPLLTHPQIFLLCRTCGILDKSVGSSIVLVNTTFGRDGCEPSKGQEGGLSLRYYAPCLENVPEGLIVDPLAMLCCPRRRVGAGSFFLEFPDFESPLQAV